MLLDIDRELLPMFHILRLFLILTLINEFRNQNFVLKAVQNVLSRKMNYAKKKVYVNLTDS